MQAVLASGNAGKVRELAALLAARDIEVIPQTRFGIVTPAGDRQHLSGECAAEGAPCGRGHGPCGDCG